MPRSQRLARMCLIHVELAFGIDICEPLLEVVGTSLVSVAFLGRSDSFFVHLV